MTRLLVANELWAGRLRERARCHSPSDAASVNVSPEMSLTVNTPLSILTSSIFVNPGGVSVQNIRNLLAIVDFAGSQR